MIEDMRLRNFSPQTQRSYLLYMAEYADISRPHPTSWARRRIASPAAYDPNPEDVAGKRELLRIGGSFFYQTTLELPWSDAHFVRCQLPAKLSVVLRAPGSVNRNV